MWLGGLKGLAHSTCQTYLQSQHQSATKLYWTLSPCMQHRTPREMRRPQRPRSATQYVRIIHSIHFAPLLCTTYVNDMETYRSRRSEHIVWPSMARLPRRMNGQSPRLNSSRSVRCFASWLARARAALRRRGAPRCPANDMLYRGPRQTTCSREASGDALLARGPALYEHVELEDGPGSRLDEHLELEDVSAAGLARGAER